MKINQRQRKALGWIVAEAIEKFNEQRAILRPREADDIYDDLESLLPLLDGDDRHVSSVVLERGGFAHPAPLKVAA